MCITKAPKKYFLHFSFTKIKLQFKNEIFLFLTRILMSKSLIKTRSIKKIIFKIVLHFKKFTKLHEY